MAERQNLLENSFQISGASSPTSAYRNRNSSGLLCISCGPNPHEHQRDVERIAIANQYAAEKEQIIRSLLMCAEARAEAAKRESMAAAAISAGAAQRRHAQFMRQLLSGVASPSARRRSFKEVVRVHDEATAKGYDSVALLQHRGSEVESPSELRQASGSTSSRKASGLLM